jgi:predicted  nucleic acid-binding Zn-ribbon protein
MNQSYIEKQANLIRLQRIDSELMLIKRLLDRMPDKQAALEEDLLSFKTKIDDAENEFEALQKQYRVLEMEVKNSSGFVEKSRAKLNAAKTNKEYQSCLKEIEDIERKVSLLEDQMLEIMEKSENHEQFVRDQKLEYERFADQVKTDLEGIERDRQAHRDRLGELEKERAETAQHLESHTLERYTQIRDQQPDGAAVAQVISAVCQGCYLNIPPQMYNELQRFDSLKFCPFCNRIIYWKSE